MVVGNETLSGGMKVIESPAAVFGNLSWNEVLKPVVKSEEVPPGFESTTDICRKLNISRSATCRRLVKAFKEGKVERITLQIGTDGHASQGYFYRIKQNEPEQNKKHRRHR